MVQSATVDSDALRLGPSAIGRRWEREGECQFCPPIHSVTDEIRSMLQNESITEVSFKQWISTDRCSLETLTQRVDVIIPYLVQSLRNLREHDFLAKEQSSFFKSRKQSLQPGEVLANGDFAQNLKFHIQGEIPDYHWVNDQVMIHTWVNYFKNSNEEVDHLSIVMISDYMKHDVASVYTFQKHNIKILRERLPLLRRMTNMTDRAAGQYKNRHNFHNLCLHKLDFNVDAKWHFSATSHGKGACDGVGGNFKRAVYQASFQRPTSDQITSMESLMSSTQN
ncbi:hypothetical protein QAD02_000814 [Eretmocerus hayati]|uniref:Uncharacterized protein n=1 Tax=Eretmocerus hayati TaxID=131215 RepID=A0ACC2NJ23_9HYME|nr:hypothetical protein QAD02_000814 [Eretmocerus hayati]